MSEHMKILTYPGLDFGDRYVITDSGVVIISETQQPMKTFHRTDDIYVCVCLMEQNKKKHSLFVHRIVAFNFIKNPCNYPIINHKDRNPLNNDVSNLEWCTYLYNNTYMDVHIERGRKISETLRRKHKPK